MYVTITGKILQRNGDHVKYIQIKYFWKVWFISLVGVLRLRMFNHLQDMAQ